MPPSAKQIVHIYRHFQYFLSYILADKGNKMQRFKIKFKRKAHGIILLLHFAMLGSFLVCRDEKPLKDFPRRKMEEWTDWLGAEAVGADNFSFFFLNFWLECAESLIPISHVSYIFSSGWKWKIELYSLYYHNHHLCQFSFFDPKKAFKLFEKIF